MVAGWLDPLEPHKGAKGNPIATASKKFAANVDLIFAEKETEWAQKIFDKNMVSAIPYTVNKKQYTNLTSEQTVAYFQKMASDLTELLKLQADLKSNLNLAQLFLRLDNFTNSKPASFTRLVYESFILGGDNLLQVVSLSKYLEDYVLQLNAHASKNLKEQLWQAFFQKYEVMTREKICNALRNSSRQRRQSRRFFSDLAILTNEANWTDEQLLAKRGQTVDHTKTVCLGLSIAMTLEMMTRYLEHAF